MALINIKGFDTHILRFFFFFFNFILLMHNSRHALCTKWNPTLTVAAGRGRVTVPLVLLEKPIIFQRSSSPCACLQFFSQLFSDSFFLQ